MRDVGGTGTISVNPLNSAGIPQMLFHPDSGVLSNGITDLALFNQGGNAAEISSVASGRVRIIAGLENQLGPWFARSSVPSDNYTTIDALVQPAVATYAAVPSVIGYILADDVTAKPDGGTMDTLAEQAIDRVQTLDIAHRPASPSYLDGGADPAIMKVGLFGGGSYPCRWISTGVKRFEGDFSINSPTFPDWQVLARAHVLDRFPGSRIWWWAQAHKLRDGSVVSADLAYPTAREIRKQTWELVGSGVTGILWFIYQDNPDSSAQWEGLAHPNSRARLDAVAEMNTRLTPDIRQRLLRCTPSASNTEFTASGGGSGGNWLYTNYSTAYISTLYDSGADAYYVVICNRSLSTAAVTISSATLTGSLVNLETGVTVPVGSSVSLPPLDGTIFRFAPISDFGVPHALPTGTETTEEWWAGHWANSASDQYVAYGDIVTHPNVVDVSAPNLQAAIDAAPDNTTFRLAPGTYDEATIIARSGLHFIPADSGNRPVLRGVSVFGHSSLATDYHDWVELVNDTEDPAAIADFLNSPAHDILFRDLDFVQDSAVLATITGPGGTSQLSHFPLYFGDIADICVEGCTFSNYRMIDGTGGASVGPTGHHGLVTATGSVRNVVVRNCTATPGKYSNNNKAWNYFAYMDGPAGCALVDNQIISTTGFNVGFALMLTNDDFGPGSDTAYDGVAGFDPITEIMNARYNAIVGNVGTTNGHFRVLYSGRNLLMADNTCPLNAAVSQIVTIAARSVSEPGGPHPGYANIDNVIRDNTYTNGSVTAQFALYDWGGTDQYPLGATLGRDTITGNSVPNGTVAKWYAQSVTHTLESPMTVTGNRDVNGTRDGV